MEEDQFPIAKDMALVWAEKQEEKRLAFEAEQERKRQDFEQRLEKQKAKREVMMLIITFAAVAAAFWTGWEARHARIEAKGAADRIFQTQIDTMQLDERPYLKPAFQRMVSFGLEPTDRKTAILESNQVLSVYGRTPALHVRIYSRCGLEHEPVLLIDEPRDGSMRLTAEFPILSPGESSNRVGCITDRPVESHEAINYYGSVFYEDIFHASHMIQFCWTIIYDARSNSTISAWPCENVVPKIT
jgi:hypothetical protein